MDQYLSSPVPRRLRVRASLTIGSQRVPLRIFAVGTTVCVIGILAVIGGADLTATLWWGGAVVLGGLIVIEGRLWGRDSRQVAAIVIRHLRRPRTLRLDTLTIPIPGEAEEQRALPLRGPRW